MSRTFTQYAMTAIESIKMKKRNPEATCATCPYGRNCVQQVVSVGKHHYNLMAECTRNPILEKFSRGHVCGEHPDFFLEEYRKDSMGGIHKKMDDGTWEKVS